ncbi:unnamed protein product [Arctia plantaginis]|uniref:PH domain-containing protein n=1 Tax=Arctia plantaginis TaxID=874455 RepID=A0A8S0ZFG4_ARCPL|nr:unnamed protein product [Arctia plantaginis]
MSIAAELRWLLLRAPSKQDMNHGGVKNVVTEPTRLENKQRHCRYCLPTVGAIRLKRRKIKGERRRGAAGRAAALRRAPSDSDCSGETASLSADSGDRAPRPLPQLPSRGKTRSRRRGSEWEVLEGLKDGQRFEKRPDVFNGYLHKKRKWPLKGWHKRFFVVDGGILVYARSPTDVARGRLHGSVDVGLSVISAKARRRRIDIDADEFIYHLRAKTPEVFRTWLNVLKTHRLYRQHLLTFGARESVPKIHAPLDDLPPTDTSSRTSSHSSESSSTYEYENHTILPSDSTSGSKITLNEQVDYLCSGKTCENHISLCSMNCVSRRFGKRDLEKRKSPIINQQKSVNISLGSTLAESQLHSTYLDGNSLKYANLSTLSDSRETSDALKRTSQPNQLVTNQQLFDNMVEDLQAVEDHRDSTSALKNTSQSNQLKVKPSKPTNNKVNETQAYYFFTKKKSRCMSPVNSMRRSKKSTNLVKYRNVFDEPALKKPISKCMLLGNKPVNYHRVISHEVACSTQLDKESNEIQVAVCTQQKKNKTFQDVMTTSDCDQITQRLIMSLIKSKNRDFEAEEYIQLVIKELYELKLDHDHPVKQLFRSLLEYWLKNTSLGSANNQMRRTQSISRQSNDYFTKDQMISNDLIDTDTKQTQFHGISVTLKDKPPVLKKPVSKMTRTDQRQCPVDCPSPKRDTESFEKERRIQELETLLKNTVYIVKTTANKKSKDKDIKITKTLIDNIGKISRHSDELKKDFSSSSTEKIQDSINHLISETSISADIAKGLLSVYLDVLLHDDSSLTNTSSRSSSVVMKLEPKCEVQTESVIKKVSKSVTNLKTENNKSNENVDPGQLYLKDILDKVTTIFSRAKKVDAKSWDSDKSQTESQDGCVTNEKQEVELGMPVKEFLGNKLIYEIIDEKSIVIDLSKYDLEHISMVSDPVVKGLMSITIKLKEKPQDMGELSRRRLKLEFSESRRLDSDITKDKYLRYVPPNSKTSDELFNKESKRRSFLELPKEFDLKPYLSSTDKANKSFRVTHESEHSLGLSFDSSNAYHREYFDNDDQQSCYIMSFRKDTLAKFQPKKKIQEKESNGLSLNSKVKQYQISPTSVFEKPTPRVIDEKFILLLLENLTLLSKNVPSLHKDINSLYLKLKKKHEKVMKACGNCQGLSFLGKIYNEESCTSNIKQVATQYSYNPTNASEDDTRDITTNTVTVKFADNKRVLDKRLSAVDFKNTAYAGSQTIDNLEKWTDSEIIPKNFKNQATNIYETNLNKVEVERALPHQNRFKPISTRERSTAIKKILDSEATHNYHFQADNNYDRDIKREKLISKVRQEKDKGISILPPLLKVSNQSQTDKVYLKLLKDRLPQKEIKVYYLYVSKKFGDAKSISMSESNMDVKQSDELKTLYRCTSEPSFYSGLLSPTAPSLRGPQAGFVSGTPGGRLAGWIIESGGPLENTSRELGQAQLSVQQLQRLLDALELQQQLHHDTDVSLDGASPSVKKDRRKFGLRKKKSNSKCSSVELQPPHIDPSSSHMALSALTAPPSPGGGSSSMPNSAASLPIGHPTSLLVP